MTIVTVTEVISIEGPFLAQKRCQCFGTTKSGVKEMRETQLTWCRECEEAQRSMWMHTSPAWRLEGVAPFRTFDVNVVSPYSSLQGFRPAGACTLLGHTSQSAQGMSQLQLWSADQAQGSGFFRCQATLQGPSHYSSMTGHTGEEKEELAVRHLVAAHQSLLPPLAPRCPTPSEGPSHLFAGSRKSLGLQEIELKMA